jgi:isopenicillin N synthase-like dioxygenase
VLPLVDVAPLLDRSDVVGVARQLDQACRRFGFVRIAGHGVPDELHERLTARSGEFFALPDSTKAGIEMARGGSAWRGWFPVGGELTSGIPDGKEGIYFGEELPPDHPGVVAGLPLHGANLFPAEPADLGPAVLEWMDAMTSLGLTLLRALAVGLGLDEHWFDDNVTNVPGGVGPTTLFRIFHYPPEWGDDDDWGVREHTDYGLLTILAQDGTSGLEVHADELSGNGGWIDVPGDPDVFVVNLGDMLERMTRGLYRSTPHRVRNTSGIGRLSFPFFLDPSWDATVTPMPLAELDGDTSAGEPRVTRERWDRTDVHAWSGTYGEYLTAKVSRVFPELFARTSSA